MTLSSVDRPLRSTVGAPAPASRHDILTLLAAGQLEEVRHVLADAPDDPFTLVARLDASVRSYEADLVDIDAVERRLTDLGPLDEAFTWWLRAILAERLLSEWDLPAIFSLLPVLQRLPTELLREPLVLFARGRLRRAASLVALALDNADVDLGLDARCLRDDAIADFRRGGFWPEAVVTRALWSAVQSSVHWEDPEPAIIRLLDARADLSVPGRSVWVLLLDYLVGSIAVSGGRLGEAIEAFDRLEANLPASSPFAMLPHLSRLLARLTAEVPDEALLDEVAAGIDALRGSHPRLVPALQQRVAESLFDRGLPAGRRFALAVLDHPVLDGVHQLEMSLLAHRLDALAGVVPLRAEVQALVDELDQRGRRRQAAVLAGRLAGDYDRLGKADDAQALRAWAQERDPTALDEPRALAASGSAERTVGAEGPAAPAGPPAPVAEIRVLGPALEVHRRGRRVDARETVAKLLLALVIAHPSPVHVEQASDVLWPDASPGAVRRRLNTVVHRLRRLVGDEGVVRRTGDLVSLDPDAVDIDLVRYREALVGPPAQAREALLAVRGNLCDTQFPYDDRFVEERRRFRAAWVATARPLVAAGAVGLAELAPALAALDLDPDEL